MLPGNLGQIDHCSRCGELRSPEQLIYEPSGPHSASGLVPICLACLEQIDPARARVLESLRRRRRDAE